MPYSPKLTFVPPLAAPARFGECCFRCLTLRGMSTCQPSVFSAVSGEAASADRRLGLEEAVVDVGAQRVQRDAAIAVVLGTGHLGTTETTAALHADALDLRRAHGGLDRLAHRAAERHAVGQLLRDTLRN